MRSVLLDIIYMWPIHVMYVVVYLHVIYMRLIIYTHTSFSQYLGYASLRLLTHHRLFFVSLN